MNRFDRVAAYMEKTVCGEHHVPGCDILIYRDHDLLYRHICGYSDREAQIPLTENQGTHGIVRYAAVGRGKARP